MQDAARLDAGVPAMTAYKGFWTMDDYASQIAVLARHKCDSVIIGTRTVEYKRGNFIVKFNDGKSIVCRSARDAARAAMGFSVSTTG